MSHLRIEKLQELIKQEVSRIILQKLKDPRIGFVTVTHVELTGDLRYAKVFLSILGKESEKQATWEALEHSLGFIRTEVGKQIHIRYTPEISFCRDDSALYSERINLLLKKVKREEDTHADHSKTSG